ncbi:MAG TPA: hypothetical protein VJG83_03045 [archaeon]|nr:hypothetical protein [archaeon]
MVYTSIQITPKTRKKLSLFKQDERETYDTLLNKFMQLIPEGDNEGKYTELFRIGLLNAKIEIKKGETVSHEQVKKSLGL